MLNDNQAREIVEGTIGRVTGRLPLPQETLFDLGITSNTGVRRLLEDLVNDPRYGVRQFQHSLDPALVSDIRPAHTIEELTRRVLELSAGKLCSNPHYPHPQPCCPYPDTCEQCGYAVL